jgi:hypothetical protein
MQISDRLHKALDDKEIGYYLLGTLAVKAASLPVFGSDASGWDCRTVATPDAGQPYRIIFAFARARSVFMRIEDGQNVYGTLSGDEIAKTMIEEI